MSHKPTRISIRSRSEALAHKQFPRAALVNAQAPAVSEFRGRRVCRRHDTGGDGKEARELHYVEIATLTAAIAMLSARIKTLEAADKVYEELH